ncbi:MAG: YciI family protein [Anaerolineales bacterium]|nr:MAG: YciI family protein [Anaerolineales bacterium]
MKTNYYVFIYFPGPNWLTNQPIANQPLAGHFQYMTRLEAEEKLVLGGGFTDDSGAMGMLFVSDLEEAREIIENDPAIKEGIVTAQLHPYFVTVAGKIQKSG